MGTPDRSRDVEILALARQWEIEMLGTRTQWEGGRDALQIIRDLVAALTEQQQEKRQLADTHFNRADEAEQQVEALRQERDTLQEEVEGEAGNQHRAITGMDASLTVVREALETYGQHKSECGKVSHRRSDDGGVTFAWPSKDCTCGFDAALRVDPQPSHVKETNDDQARVAGQCDPGSVLPQRAEE